MRSACSLAGIGAVTTWFAAMAAAQTGPLVDNLNWQGGVGVSSGNLLVNTDGDPALESYPIIPMQLADNVVDVDFELSPGGDIIFARAFGSALTGACSTGDNQPYFFRLVQDNDSGGHLETIFNGGVCLNGPVPDHEGLYRSPDGRQYIAYMVEPKDSSASVRQAVHWFNLNGLNERGETQLNVDVDGIYIQFTPDGSAVLVKHGLVSQPTDADYTLVDLCPPPRLGDSLSSDVGGILFDLGVGDPTAAVVETSPGSFAVEISHPDILPSGSFQIALTPCEGAPLTEACCFPDAPCQDLEPTTCASQGGTAQGAGSTCATADCGGPETIACCTTAGSCADVTEQQCLDAGGSPGAAGSTCAANFDCPPPAGTQACCLANGLCLNAPVANCVNFFNGTPQGDGVNCFDPATNCPSRALSITKTGPVSVRAGSIFQYVLSYENIGDADATGVVVEDTLPNLALFVSADSGGMLIGPGPSGTVSWTIGGLPVGAAGQVTVTVQAHCSATQLNNSSYRITSNEGGLFPGAPAVSTTVTPAQNLPVNVNITSVPVAPAAEPLMSGDLIEHTITIENTAAFEQVVRFTTSAGQDAAFDSVVDDAGGEFNITNPVNFSWSGIAGANATIAVIFRTRIDDCISDSVTRLNRNSTFMVRSACGPTLGQASAPTLALQKPLSMSLVATNLSPPKPAPFGSGGAIQLARLNSGLNLMLDIVNDTPVDQNNMHAEAVLPAELVVNDPPFAQPIPAGAAYDSNTRLVTYDGPVPAQSTVTLLIDAMFDPASDCQTSLSFRGRTGMCAANEFNLNASVTILVVPDLPQGEYVVGLDNFRGLWIHEPGVSPAFKNYFCFVGEIYSQVARRGNGEFWIAGLPTVRFDPAALDCDSYEFDFFENVLGMSPGDNPAGVAADPADDTLVFSVRTANGAALMRYDPTAGSAVQIPSDDPLPLGAVLIDFEGRICVLSGDGLVRVDPTDPSNTQTFTGLAVPNPPGVATLYTSAREFTLDSDGNYLMMIENAYFVGQNVITFNSIGKFDRDTGAFSLPVYSLQTLTPFIFPNRGIAGATVGNDQTIYFGQDRYPTRLFELDRSCGEVVRYLGEAMGPTLRFTDMSTRDLLYGDPLVMSPVPEDVPGDPMLLSAVSRRTHGAAGDLDLDLPLGPPDEPAVEPRQGGPTRVVLTFNEPVRAADGSIDANELTITGAGAAVATCGGVNAHELSIELSGVPDGSCVTISLAGLVDLAGNPLVGDTDVQIRVLEGDSDGNGTVEIDDLMSIRMRLFQAVDAGHLTRDVTVDGVINIVDMNAAKGNLAGTASCP